MKTILIAIIALATFAPTAKAGQGTAEDQVIEWINSADAEELKNVKGIGDAYAKRIIAARVKQEFHNYDDILAVKGIGPKTLEKIKEYVESIDPD
jgi:competence protein ComEA